MHQEDAPKHILKRLLQFVLFLAVFNLSFQVNQPVFQGDSFNEAHPALEEKLINLLPFTPESVEAKPLAASWVVTKIHAGLFPTNPTFNLPQIIFKSWMQYSALNCYPPQRNLLLCVFRI